MSTACSTPGQFCCPLKHRSLQIKCMSPLSFIANLVTAMNLVARRNQRLVALCASIVHATALYLFLSGFLQIRSGSIPRPSDKRPSSASSLHGKFDRLAFVLIDALRADFVYDDKSPMVFTKRYRKLFHCSLIHERKCTVPLIAKARPPTVTLPRLKALTAGTQPVFLDLMSNLSEGTVAVDSGAVSEGFSKSNWVETAHRSGLKLVFYGDNTWIRLFGKRPFLRHTGIQTFFVYDTTTTDLVISDRAAFELGQNDWDIMILHYAGVDHIGHIQGAYGPLMEPKLAEMDGAIKEITEALAAKDAAENRSSLLVVLGDHGMTDGGNHGGATPDEVNTAALLIFPSLSGRFSSSIEAVEQVDIATTIPLLLGLPIPSESTGVIIRRVFEDIGCSEDEVAAYLASNFEQLYNLAASLVGGQFAKLFSQGFSNAKDNSGRFSALHAASAKVSGLFGSYNMHRIAAGLFLLLLSLPVYGCIYSAKSDFLTVLYAVTQFASSFVEEEHLFWFFACQLFLLVDALRLPTLKALLSMLAVRIIHTWNSNGDHWRNLPDMKTWLGRHPAIDDLLLGLALSYFCLTSLRRRFDFKRGVPFSAAAALIFLYKCSVLDAFHTVATARACYLLIAAGFVLCRDSRFSVSALLILLAKRHNTILFVALDLVVSPPLSDLFAIAVMQFSYFALGSSHLISSVDVSNSFTGLSTFNPVFVALLTFLVTWSGPIFCSFLLPEHSHAASPFSRLVVQVVVMLSATIQRYHLFIWTVYSPRLLFEVFWVVFYAAFIWYPSSITSQRASK